MRTVQSALLVAATIMVVEAASADAQQTYPNRPVQLVVPVPPGGAADFIARTVSAKLADAVGQPVVINNQGGAGGTIASRGVARADPDGYTLLLNSITTHGIGPHLYANLPYDPVTDFAPVILLARLPLIMTVSAALPAGTVQEVVGAGKGAAGTTRLCVFGKRRRAASRRRAVQDHHLHRSPARAVPRQRPGRGRCRRRPHCDHVRCGAFAAAVHHSGQAPPAGRRKRRTPPPPPRPADLRRTWIRGNGRSRSGTGSLLLHAHHRRSFRGSTAS